MAEKMLSERERLENEIRETQERADAALERSQKNEHEKQSARAEFETLDRKRAFLQKQRREILEVEAQADPAIAAARQAVYNFERRCAALSERDGTIVTELSALHEKRGRLVLSGGDTTAVTEEIRALLDEHEATGDAGAVKGTVENELRRAVEMAISEARQRRGLPSQG